MYRKENREIDIFKKQTRSNSTTIHNSLPSPSRMLAMHGTTPPPVASLDPLTSTASNGLVISKIPSISAPRDLSHYIARQAAAASPAGITKATRIISSEIQPYFRYNSLTGPQGGVAQTRSKSEDEPGQIVMPGRCLTDRIYKRAKRRVRPQPESDNSIKRSILFSDAEDGKDEGEKTTVSQETAPPTIPTSKTHTEPSQSEPSRAMMCLTKSQFVSFLVASLMALLFLAWAFGGIGCGERELPHGSSRFGQMGALVGNLESCLRSRVYGQEMAIGLLAATLTRYWNEDERSPHTPLGLVLHGCTGCGKSYMTQVLLQCLYPAAENSDCSHHFVAPLHFWHPRDAKFYVRQVHQWISQYSGQATCPIPLFVFDEADEIPSDTMALVKPLLALPLGPKVKPLFLFLSHYGESGLLEYTDRWYQEGKERSGLGVEGIQALVKRAAGSNQASYPGQQGFVGQRSGDVDSHVVSKNLAWPDWLKILNPPAENLLPFLPLDRKHIEMCTVADLKCKNIAVDSLIVRQIISQMQYVPDGSHLFSADGCKRVSALVDLIAH